MKTSAMDTAKYTRTHYKMFLDFFFFFLSVYNRCRFSGSPSIRTGNVFTSVYKVYAPVVSTYAARRLIKYCDILT